MDHKSRQPGEAVKAAWGRHNLEQLLYFRSLSLRQKLQAVEGMCDVARRFEQMRVLGKFRVGSGAARETGSGYTRDRKPDKADDSTSE
jgi:hypothetical protein